MNILFVIASLGVGGAQSFLLRMLSAFPKEHNIYLYDVHPKQREDEILSNLTADIPIFSSKYERIEIKLQKYPLIFTKILNRLNRYFNLKTKIDKKYFNKIIKQKQIQIINSHLYLADSFVIDNCMIDLPKVSSFHGCYNLIWDQKRNSENFEKIKTNIQNILNNYSGVITAADRHNEVLKNYEIQTKEEIQKIDDFKLKQQYNLPENSFIFGMIARGDKTKGWQEAINFIVTKQKDLKLYLFSDEPEWIKTNFKTDFEFEIINTYSSIADMQLMSLCKHNIIANSSFSWWGAWLNQNPDKIVIAPKQWFAAWEYDTKDLIPEKWLRF